MIMCTCASSAVPEVIDCGCCLVGGEKVLLLECENRGGEGSFWMREDTDTRQHTLHNEVLCVCVVCVCVCVCVGVWVWVCGCVGVGVSVSVSESVKVCE